MSIHGAWAAALALLTTACSAPAATTIHVATTGNDAGDGSVAKPVASLNRAKELVRAAKAAGPVTVELAAGTYELAETFVLGRTTAVPRRPRSFGGRRPAKKSGSWADGWSRAFSR